MAANKFKELPRAEGQSGTVSMHVEPGRYKIEHWFDFMRRSDKDISPGGKGVYSRLTKIRDL